jgi:hypothetical protein
MSRKEKRKKTAAARSLIARQLANVFDRHMQDHGFDESKLHLAAWMGTQVRNDPQNTTLYEQALREFIASRNSQRVEERTGTQ